MKLLPVLLFGLVVIVPYCLRSFHGLIYRFLIPKNTVFRLATNGLDTVLYIKRKGKVEKVCLYQPKITFEKLEEPNTLVRINEYEMY